MPATLFKLCREIILSQISKLLVFLENQILFWIRAPVLVVFGGLWILTLSLLADAERTELNIGFSVGGIGGYYEIGPILDQIQAEAAFDEQISDSLVDEVEEEVTDFVEDAVQSELDVDMGDAVEDELIFDVEDTVETELIVDVEDTVEGDLDVDIGESFIGEQGLGIAVIAEEVVNAFDVDIEYESARFHSGQWLVMADAIAFEELAQRHGDFAITAVAAEAAVANDGAITDLSLGLGGVEDRPIVANTAAFLGKPATEETARDIAETVADTVDPMIDLQANADYRRQLVRVLGARVLSAAFLDATTVREVA